MYYTKCNVGLTRLDEKSGVFPRVKQCNDQSWCCSNTTGAAVASDVEDCCSNGEGVFIDALGEIISTSTSLSVTPTSITAKTSGLPTATGTTSTATGDPSVSAPKSSVPNTATDAVASGEKIGIGVGAGVGALILTVAGITSICYRKRRRSEAQKSNRMHQEVPSGYQWKNGSSAPLWKSNATGAQELPDTPPREMPDTESRSKNVGDDSSMLNSAGVFGSGTFSSELEGYTPASRASSRREHQYTAYPAYELDAGLDSMGKR